jgi:cytochrome c biogenesis factor
MDIGTALLWLSLLFAVGTLACSFFLWATKKVIYRNLAIFSTVFCMLALTGAYIVLTKYFLDDNFDIHYVWGHSGTNLKIMMTIQMTNMKLPSMSMIGPG